MPDLTSFSADGAGICTVKNFSILFIITGLYPGGAEKIVLELVRNLLRRGYSCTVVSLQKRPCGKEQTLVNALEEAGAEVIFLGVDLLHLWRLSALRKIVKDKKPSIIHSHLMHGNLAGRFAAWGSSIPLVNTIHIAEKRNCFKVKILFLLDRLTRRQCGVCTAVSPAAAHFHEKRCSMQEGSIRVILNGSDPVRQASAEESKAFREKYGLESVQKIIGSLGRLDPQKGYDLFLETAEELHELIPEDEHWGILLMGEGPERRKLEEIISRKAPVCPRLKFVLTGYLPDGRSFLGVPDLFVMPSRYEGFGLTLTEALSCGTPCLCSEADSLPGLCALSPENTLCAPFIPGKMKEVYRKALSLPRTKGKVLHDCSAMTDEYLSLYREKLSIP